jgi:hypothetical protein
MGRQARLKEQRRTAKQHEVAELNGISAFDYLVALQRHHDEVAASPSEWMPWSYHAALARLGKPAAPPG